MVQNTTDADFVSYRFTAAGAAAGAPAARTWSLAEREGNGWYFVPAAPAGLAAQAAIPVNSLRIGLVGVSGQQPIVIPGIQPNRELLTSIDAVVRESQG